MIELTDKMMMAGVAMGGSLIMLVYYAYVVFWGQVRPHFYSWFIWGLVGGIAAAAQFSAGGGAGAWVTAMGSFACLARAVMALFKGERTITRGDNISLGFCLLAIVLWIMTNEPLWSVIIVTIIDLVGFYPTFRKSWAKPDEENAITFVYAGLVYYFSILAMEDYSLTTMMYPVAMVAIHIIFVAFLLLRRKSLA